VIVIERLDDPRLADYRQIGDPIALQRRGLFVAEGRLVVRRVLQNRRFRPHSILLTAAAHLSVRADLSRCSSSAPVYLVDQTIMNDVVGFNIHRGCLALVNRPDPLGLADLPLATAQRLLVLESVSNPDNIGGLFRDAAAFGVEAVVLGPGCGDPFYRKAVRTSMAATLMVPFATAGSWPDAIERLRHAGMCVVALTPAPDATPLQALRVEHRRLALMVGSEGEGLSGAALAAADLRVQIAMRGRIDSLNVATAAAIALYSLDVNRTS
jgi:tRNA G18 (ribose-2'-O)-methylase SpoU